MPASTGGGLRECHSAHTALLNAICCCWVAQPCPTLCNPMDCSLSASSFHGISQARMLEWLAISFSRESSPTQGSNLHLLHCMWILYCWATREALLNVVSFFLQICSPHWAVNSKDHSIFLSRTEYKLLLNGWMKGKMDIFNNSYARQLGLSGRKFLEDEVN